MSAALMGSMERSRCDLWIMPCAQDQPWSPRRNRPVRTRMPGGVGPAADLLGQLAGTRFGYCFQRGVQVILVLFELLINPNGRDHQTSGPFSLFLRCSV